jgi:hypothetical protein
MLFGCAASSGVLVNPNATRADYRSVYIVVHGDNSADMDANLQREFLRHGFSVTAGPDGGAAPGTQLIAKYADDWKWDMAMYLHSLDVMVFDGKTNLLLASGSWKNSTLHGFYSSEKVVSKVVDNTLSRITAQ